MRIVSLFAGCGGLDLGFEKAGFNIVWANEFDKSVYETYRLNHPNTILNTSDVRTLSEEDIPSCDGIIGGPPCQPWSEGGKSLGIDDSRGKLFLEYIRIVKEKKPKFFVIENVKGILEKKHKASLDSFLKLLTGAGYIVSYELLNAVDYKVPQDRFRVFFVGIRRDLKIKFKFPDAVCSTPITLHKAIGDIIEEPRYFNDEIVDSDNPQRPNHDTYVGTYDSKYMARNRVRTWDEPSFTIQAQARNAPQHPRAPRMVYISANQRIFVKGFELQYRRLSVRECARIQTFPDSFIFKYLDVKDGYKMVGNAVPPRLAWYIAIQLKYAFSNIVSVTDCRKNIDKPIIRRISVNNIFVRYSGGHIVNNLDVLSNYKLDFSLDKNVLVGLVKSENSKHYLNKTANIYYTGKFFPSTVNLNDLYYFMPYIKGKGIRDLYIIKVVKVGSKKDVYLESCDKDFRLLFEIEFVKQLFDDYRPVHLNIWHTFTDTTIFELLKMNELEDSE